MGSNSARPRIDEETKDDVLALAQQLGEMYPNLQIDGKPSSFQAAVEAVATIAQSHLQEEIQMQKLEALQQAQERRQKAAQYRQVQETTVEDTRESNDSHGATDKNSADSATLSDLQEKVPADGNDHNDRAPETGPF